MILANLKVKSESRPLFVRLTRFNHYDVTCRHFARQFLQYGTARFAWKTDLKTGVVPKKSA